VNILITGAKGFIGKNLIAELKNRDYVNILEFDRDTDFTLLIEYTKIADFIFHLAGANRPKKEAGYMEDNYSFTDNLLNLLKRQNNKCPIMFSSSIQAELDNPYGLSKKAGEELLLSYAEETGVKVLIYRFTNVFGKWSLPNYNSVIATFSHNIAHNLPIEIINSKAPLTLVYIDDLVNELLNALEGNENKSNKYCDVDCKYEVTLQEVVDTLYSFKRIRENGMLPDLSNKFIYKLYSTYLSYLPQDQFSYNLKIHEDNRGVFAEFLKTPNMGQVSINITKPGYTKGNHWHHTKNEKFLVVTGSGVINFRNINSDKVLKYYVSSDKLQVIDIPVGYTHNIVNTGDVDLVTIMWANEVFDPNKPDTFYLEV